MVELSAGLTAINLPQYIQVGYAETLSITKLEQYTLGAR